MPASAAPSGVRRAELVATLSLGTDLGFGQPMEHVLRQCLPALRLGERVGLGEGEREVTYYSGLLAWVGCHVDAYEQAKWFGDDIALKAEQAVIFADEESPAFLLGGYRIVSSAFKDRPQLEERFRAGEGFGWHEHDPDLFAGTEQFFRPGYRAHLLAEWIPALEGVEEKLRAGGKVADVGCGHGVSTTLIAQAFPQSSVRGFDYHEGSIERARERAREEGVDNVEYAVAAAKDLPGEGYDLVCFFDCLHDMGDPVGAMTHVREALAEDGTVMLVEPRAADSLEGNLNPFGRMFYAASTLLCTPNSLDQEVALGLGAQAGEARLRAVAEEAGFSRFRRATETPFNLVLEARP